MELRRQIAAYRPIKPPEKNFRRHLYIYKHYVIKFIENPNLTCPINSEKDVFEHHFLSKIFKARKITHIRNEQK